MHTYPLLDHVMRSHKVNLKNVLLLACQHLLHPQQKMFEHCLKLGLKPENCIIIDKNYSTNVEVMKNLKMLGCIVSPYSTHFDHTQSFDTWFMSILRDFLTKELQSRKLESYKKIIILDDGGFMHLAVNDVCGNLSNLVGIEQTSSGHHKITAAQIKFQTVSIARSKEKLVFESPHIAYNVCERVSLYLKKIKNDNPDILVMGLGAVGSLIAKQMSDRGYLVSGFDPNDTVKHIDGIEMLDEKSLRQKIHKFNVIIGASGFKALDEDDIYKLHPHVTLISASSSDREFPATLFRKKESHVHDEYVLENKTLINGGFPITFDGKDHAAPPAEIEFTIALLFMNVLHQACDCIFNIPNLITEVFSLWKHEDSGKIWWKEFRESYI